MRHDEIIPLERRQAGRPLVADAVTGRGATYKPNSQFSFYHTDAAAQFRFDSIKKGRANMTGLGLDGGVPCDLTPS